MSFHSTENTLHGDVQLWNKDASPWTQSLSESDSYQELQSPVELLRIPLTLVITASLSVYTDNPETQEYLQSVMGWEAVHKGSLGRAFRNRDTVLVLRITSETLACVVLHLGKGHIRPPPELNFWYSEDELTTKTKDSLLQSTVPSASIPSTLKFDKVLQKRKLSANPFLVRDGSTGDGGASPSQRNSSTKTILSSSEQIEQTISKLILSGLRIRGLSINPSHSVNDKLTIKEIYHTTFKSAVFALRKYNYSFNTASSVQLHQVQDIVEKLLQTYVDVDAAPST